ncbi:MAG: histidine phosphatase family protein [Patescibacteria group bacterium]
MSVQIIFETHSTSVDNEKEIASGWFDCDLSELGKEQAKDVGMRRSGENFDAIFVSDLKRAVQTAQIAFNDKFPIIQDARLRECDYGDMNGKPEDEVKWQKPERIDNAFPNGESYRDTNVRMKLFLKDLLYKYDGKRVMIVGHRATQYALESLILSKSLEEVIPAPWSWQPGWEYELKEI